MAQGTPRKFRRQAIKPAILITGITGMIGSALAEHLSDVGYQVHGTVRSSQVGIPSNLPVEHVYTYNLEDPMVSVIPLHMFDSIIHCAAVTSEMDSDLVRSRRANVDGTKFIITEAIRSRVRRFIYISSMSAHPANPSAYARSKLEAERVVRSARGIEWVILRPGLVVSRSPRGIFSKIFKLVSTGWVVPIVTGINNLSTVHIDDLCEAISRSIETKHAAGLSIDVAAEECLTFSDIVDALANSNGTRIRRLRVTPWALLGAAYCLRWTKSPAVTRDNVYGLINARSPDSSHLVKILGLEPTNLRESLERLGLLNGPFSSRPRHLHS